MKSGRYLGSIEFYSGRAGFRYGRLMIPNDNLLQLNFTLTVEHMLKVNSPGGKVELTPEGGCRPGSIKGKPLPRSDLYPGRTSSQFKMQNAVSFYYVGRYLRTA